MNETKWNVLDDDFYIIRRGWFDAWKKFICYDYILLKILTEQRKVNELSFNKVVHENSQGPGSINNSGILLREVNCFYSHFKEGWQSIHPLRENMND